MKRLCSSFLCLLAFMLAFNLASGTCDWGYMCDNGECTLTSYDRCDGKRDCSDGSDEQNCLTCRRGYRCDNGECTLLSTDRCDGRRDCSDASDEKGCLTCPYGWRCDNGECTLSDSDRCNGFRDCSDSSDEQNCTSCGFGNYLCENKECTFSRFARCDDIADCSDGSDERDCGLSFSAKLGIGLALTGVVGMATIAIIIIAVTLRTRYYNLNRNGSRYRVIRMAPVTVATVQQEL